MGDYYTDVYPMEEAFMASLGKSVASLLEVGEDAIDILEIGSGNIIGRPEREDFFRTFSKCTNSDSSQACRKSQPGICFPLLHSVVSDNSVSGQRRPWSDCANAQAGLDLRCPHMSGDTFSHGAVHYWNGTYFYVNRSNCNKPGNAADLRRCTGCKFAKYRCKEC